MLVDTIGLILAVIVHAGDLQDREGAKWLFAKVRGCFPRMQLVWADGGYAGQLIGWLAEFCRWTLEIVKRTDDVKGFRILPRRWVVERTFAWLSRCRSLSKDYEELTANSEAIIPITMIRLMLQSLATDP